MSNKQIAKNTGFLYFRLFIAMVISFYSSRILLKELGVEDYGIYNVVGSLVAIFSSLKGFLTSSTQRFLNFEMGKGNKMMVNRIFNTSLIVHLLIAVIFVLLIESIGLWFLYKVLVIPEIRFNTAFWVFHLSALTIIVSIMTVPYDSVLIANERMNVFAYLSIFDNILKLLSVLLLFVVKGDKLLYYSIFVLFSSVVIRTISASYCKRNFSECETNLVWDKELFSKMGKFAGWQFLGNTSFALQNQGLNMVLNIYFGPLLNAARGIAMQANTAIQSFIQNMMIAINPQLTKRFSSGELNSFYDLFYQASKYSFLLFSFLSFPVIIFTEELLSLWLGIVPTHVVSFLRLLVVYSLIRVFHNPIDSVFKAAGDIKKYQLIDSFILVLALPLTVLFYKLGYSPLFMYIAMIIVEVINLTLILNLARVKVNLDLKKYYSKVLKSCLYIAVLSAIYFTTFIMLDLHVLTHKVLLGILFLFLHSIGIFYLGFNKNEKKYIVEFLKRKL